MREAVSGFSKKSKTEKIQWLCDTYLGSDPSAISVLKQYWNSDEELQILHDDFIENTLSNYYLPFAIAPNFRINNQLFAIPMVIEESSVVAAASNAAKFWLDKGGFSSEVISTTKNGQVHLNYFGSKENITLFFSEIKSRLLEAIAPDEASMKKRGGGLLSIELIDSSEALEGYFQIHCTFETRDAMGANFINTCLEKIAETFAQASKSFQRFQSENQFPEVVMSILSNYVPECLVRAQVSCNVADLTHGALEGRDFAKKFIRAIDIAKTEPRRTVTHNKGIMNGIDAVILATGNDFRAVEAGIHAYAAKNGRYSSLTHAKLEGDTFTFWIEIPLAVGTVGGLTSLHPLVKFAFSVLQEPNAKELMQMVAVAGLAQNFAAVRSLVTTGIQKGHMKMHLMNILNQLKASPSEKEKALVHFKKNSVSYGAVKDFISDIR